jgi:glycosyltransferase involved in cell wall biosynthesis
MTRIAVCITTYRRPDGLARTLASLNGLTFERTPDPQVSIVIVDNDPAGGSRDAFERARATLRFPAIRVVEGQRGISYARNRALDEAGNDVDFLAFIDDDERPDPAWLDALCAAQAAYGADAVTGPVLPEFDPRVPAWAIAGGFFERERFPTGRPQKDARTGNVLIRQATVARLELRFDHRFALTGGEDTHFFERLRRGGGAIVWADDAIVYETVPPERARMRYLVSRSYRYGNSQATLEIEFDPRLRTYLVRGAKGVGRLCQGLACLPVSWLFGTAGVCRALRRVAYGLGIFTGLAGRRYRAYPQ